MPDAAGQPAPAGASGYGMPALPSHLPPAVGGGPAANPSPALPAFGLSANPWDAYGPTAVGSAGFPTHGYQGFEAGVDLVFFRPYLGSLRSVTAVVPDDPPVTFTTRFPPNRFDPTLRAWLGYAFSSGLGFRVRYWEFHQALASETGTFEFPMEGLPPAFAGTTITGRSHLVARTLDGEVNQRIELGPLRTLVGGGIRYAEFQRWRTATIAFPFETLEIEESGRFFGVGPTLFVELQRPLADSGFSLVAVGRGSILFGPRIEQSDLLLPWLALDATFETHRDVAIGVGEIQLGIEWATCLHGGANLFARAMWEAQLWSATGNPLGSDANAGFQGFSIHLGLQR